MSGRPARLARLALLLALALASACGVSAAQVTPLRTRSRPDSVIDLRGRLPGSTVRERDLPLFFSAMPPPDLSRMQRVPPPLHPLQAARLRIAIQMRQGGLAARARDTLLAIDHDVPHHPSVLLELARAEMALGQEAAAAARLRALRTAQHDSLVGSHDLALALEHAGKPREAAAVAVESWIASPAEGAWAQEQVLRLAPADVRGVTEALRSAAQARPWRGDMVRGLALLLARQGQSDEAVKVLAAADAPRKSIAQRSAFADEAILTGIPADSAGAIRALVSAAGETAIPAHLRAVPAQRALDLAEGSARRADVALQLARALDDVPAERWGAGLLLGVTRELRGSGHTAQAEALLARGAGVLRDVPELELERLLAELREGPPARALPGLDSLTRVWPAARWMHAEALFFAGELDSAHAEYGRVSEDAGSGDAMAALDRSYLLEEDPGAPALRALGAIAYARWRGDATRARALADSLWLALPRSSKSYAQAALQAWGVRADAGAWREALAPLAAVADSLPGDRLAPLARQRAGEAYLALGDARQALAQFEECLARYPRAWNAAEVRRRVDQLRKDRRL